MFMIGIPLAIVVGGPVAGLLLGMNGLLGLAGWQWLFLLEGAPAIVLGVVVWAYLPDGPAQARWLAPEQRAWLSECIEAEQKAALARHGVGLRQALVASDGVVAGDDHVRVPVRQLRSDAVGAADHQGSVGVRPISRSA